MSKAEHFLMENIQKEAELHYGLKDKIYLNNVLDSWSDYSSECQRWKEIEHFNDHRGKILDMAAGVGTFVFHGLSKGYDVYGIEPEEWKLDYIERLVKEHKLPNDYSDRIKAGIGEDLPFADNSFDLVTTWQTLEHVQDVEKCLDEMLRVVKPGGKVRISAPDYRCWYEPHYRLPFLPCMNRYLAAIYLRILNKPTKGLNNLVWTTSPRLLKHLKKNQNIECIDLTEVYKRRRIDALRKKYKIPFFLSKIIETIISSKKVFREENHIRIVIRKLP